MLTLTLSLLVCLPAPLTGRLADRSYRVRDGVHRALAALGRLAVPHLERAAKGHPDPEVRARAACLLRPFAEEIAEREAARMPNPPMWTPFWAWEHDPWRQWVDEAAARLGVSYTDPECRRLATRLWTVSRLLQCRPRHEILAELARMAAAE